MFSLKGKVALITGAATGLGQAIAVALAQCGADIAISDKQVDRLTETEALALPSGRRSYKVAIDVRDLRQVRAGVTTTEEVLGRVDILINNAGINHPSPGLEVSPEQWEDHFNTNVRGRVFRGPGRGAGDDRQELGAHHLYLQSVGGRGNSRTACLLRNQGRHHPTGANSRPRMGETRNHGQLHSSDFCGDQSHARAIAKFRVPPLRGGKNPLRTSGPP
jgi:NAD(P)-dependent dehydrogenase (short-subunit alcohol dehydrogenase family)